MVGKARSSPLGRRSHARRRPAAAPLDGDAAAPAARAGGVDCAGLPLSFTSFGVVLILGGPRYATLETEIYNQAARLFDLRAAAALSLLQLTAIAIVLAVTGVIERRAAVIVPAAAGGATSFAGRAGPSASSWSASSRSPQSGSRCRSRPSSSARSTPRGLRARLLPAARRRDGDAAGAAVADSVELACLCRRGDGDRARRRWSRRRRRSCDGARSGSTPWSCSRSAHPP